MPEEAVATLDTPVDTAVDTAEVDSAATEGGADTTADTGDGAESEGSEPTAHPEGSGRFLSESDKAILAEIKAKDPKLAARVRNALFSAEAFKKAIPGGLREVQQMRQQLEEIGGFERIHELQTEAQEWDALDQQFLAADPKFVENVAEASPEAFMALAPAVFGKFQELAPEAYSAYVSQVFVADMMQEGIPLALERLQDFIGDNPKAIAIWKQLADYVNRVNGFAQKKVDVPKPGQKQQPDARASELDEREANLTRMEWKSAADADRMSVFNSEFSRLTAGRKISDTQKAAIKELYVSRLQAALRKSPNFNQNIDRYFSNRDKQGYLRYISSIYRQEIPKALKSAIDSVIPSKLGAVKATTQAQVAKPGMAAAKPAQGFIFQPQAPKSTELDMTHPFNTPQNWSAGKAILKDGRKIQWKR